MLDERDLPHNVDPKVVLRAIRFAAEVEGYRLSRGSRMDVEFDRADRWYATPLDASPSEEQSLKENQSGHPTIREALKEVRERNMVEKRSSKRKPVDADVQTSEGSTNSGEWDQPSQAPGFEGATPQAVARALFRPVSQNREDK